MFDLIGQLDQKGTGGAQIKLSQDRPQTLVLLTIERHNAVSIVREPVQYISHNLLGFELPQTEAPVVFAREGVMTKLEGCIPNSNV